MEFDFSPDFFVNNRKKLRQLFTGTAPIVMSANGQVQRGGDSAYAFQQDASFWYLTGIDEPDVVLVMDRDKEYVIVPERTASREAFDGAIDTQALSDGSGIDTIYSHEEGWNILSARIAKVKHAATVAAPPAYIDSHGFYTNPARAGLITKLKNLNQHIELLDLTPHIMRMRMVKQPVEVDAIKRAIDITIGSLRTATSRSKLSKYSYEYELEAELTKQFRVRGGSGNAFDPIVAGGRRACTLHNTANSGNIDKQQLLLMDVGAEYCHYAADISRTVALTEPTKRQRDIHAAVIDVQDYAVSLLKPGVLLRDYETQVSHYLGEKLRELGLVKTVSAESTREFCPHAVSHFLGLNVHDVGDYERPLEPGVVLTVEPGIYIPAENIGVRIEDDVLITARGTKVLSSKLSRKLS